MRSILKRQIFTKFYKFQKKLRTKKVFQLISHFFQKPIITKWLTLYLTVKLKAKNWYISFQFSLLIIFITIIKFYFFIILVKKAYHKLSLKVHPDRVAEEEKLEATEKFKVLGSIHAILTDTSKRALYDETKCVDDDDYNVIVDRDWSVYWRLLFKKITDEDIRAYEKEYVGKFKQHTDTVFVQFISFV